MENTKDLLHGNIKRELIALMLPLILNTGLDRVFVAKFQWETAATVLAQSMAFIWCLWVMKKSWFR